MAPMVGTELGVKSAQALRYLLGLASDDRGGVDGTNVLKLMKLLWAADRYSLRSLGEAMSGDRYSALPYGPVPSTTYNLVKAAGGNAEAASYVSDDDAQLWSSLFEVYGPDVHLQEEPGADRLSPADVQMLERAYSQFRSEKRFNLASDISHRYPEWKRYEENFRPGQLERKSFAIEMMDFFDNPVVDPYFEEDPEVLAASKYFFEQRRALSQDTGLPL